jgi:hypothetical protein
MNQPLQQTSSLRGTSNLCEAEWLSISEIASDAPVRRRGRISSNEKNKVCWFNCNFRDNGLGSVWAVLQRSTDYKYTENFVYILCWAKLYTGYWWIFLCRLLHFPIFCAACSIF